MSSTRPTPSKDFYVHIGAPEPIRFQRRSGGTLVSLDDSLKFQYVTPTETVILTVGDGITLSDQEGVTNARATVQLTIEQSRRIPKRGRTRFEIQRTDDGRQRVMLMGKLIGEGGDNPDG